LVPGLRALHTLRLHSQASDLTDLATPEDEVVHGDIAELDEARSIVSGTRVVVHLAGRALAPSTWEEVLRPNIIGMHALFEAARLEGVERVVLASTNHVTGQYDLARDWPIGPERPVAPDGFYAVSKVLGEALGSYYAWRHGIRVVCLRIGWVLDAPFDEKSERLWLSPRDLVQLVDRSIVADIRFGIFYGVSGLVPDRYDLDGPRRLLGYAPQDAISG
jgi:nucleoside-diphosphate-sugar epimerase